MVDTNCVGYSLAFTHVRLLMLRACLIPGVLAGWLAGALLLCWGLGSQLSYCSTATGDGVVNSATYCGFYRFSN